MERLNKYGITISGHLQSFGDANYKWYAFVADGVEINEEDSKMKADGKKMRIKELLNKKIRKDKANGEFKS